MGKEHSKSPARSGAFQLFWQAPMFLLVGAVLGALIWDAAKPSSETGSPVPAPATVTAPIAQPAFPTTRPSAPQAAPPDHPGSTPTTAGQPDAYGRLPGDPHYGHNHP